MDHETQVRIVREVFDAIDRGRPPLAERFTRNDPLAYTSPGRAEREMDALFRRRPLVAGFSCQVREPGDWFADDLGPVPLLVTRDRDGGLRAFANVCRHRGARIAKGCGKGARGFSCPYHGWSYDLDGSLDAVPDDYGFEGLDRASHGLVPLPVAERYGLVWVGSTPGEAIRIDDELAGLGRDLEAYEPFTREIQERRVLRRSMNWKLASDTFWEAYHLKVLHQHNIAPLFLANMGHFEAFGSNHRFVGIRSSIESLRGKPESEWSLLPHGTILLNLFPNTIYVMQSDHVEVYRIFPERGRPDACLTEATVLVPERSERFGDTMRLLCGVIEQDYETGEEIQRSFETGLLPHVNYGRYEAALEHFHRSIRDAL